MDRREQTIISLNQTNEELNQTLQTLQSELVASNDESESLTKELDTLRTRISSYEQSSREGVIRDRELRELREEAERLRLDKEELERTLQVEGVEMVSRAEEMGELRKDLETERMLRVRAEEELEKESERARNLQGVLEDFQAGALFSEFCRDERLRWGDREGHGASECCL